MSDWGAGYITDTSYVLDFCRVQVPAMLSFAALAGGVEGPGGGGEPISYCDLGCGQGYTASLIAAANPDAQVLGIDFNPSHVANARGLAQSAGLANVMFREAGFQELAEEPPVPQFDIIASHGVLGWVSAENRRALVAAVAKWLRPGGLFYVSYDCMPGWAGVAPLRRIMARGFAPRPGLSSAAALALALAYADALRAADARYFKLFPDVESRLARLKNAPPRYLAHELLTRDWEAFSFGQVAEELSAAKLVYVGSAYLTDEVDRVNLTEAQQQFLAGIDDLVLNQESRDMLLGRQFRRDVFAKGATATSPARLRARWLETRFALTCPDGDFDMTFETSLGKLQLRPDIHGPLIEQLRAGPITLREAIERAPALADQWISTVDGIKVLVGRGDLQPSLPAAGDASRKASVDAFNRAVLARVTDPGEPASLASPVTGGGVRVDRMSRFYLLVRSQKGDPAPVIARLMQHVATAEKQEAPLSEEAARDVALKEIERIETTVVPMLRKVGIA
jgi:SAM-dependent methyltransferase